MLTTQVRLQKGQKVKDTYFRLLKDQLLEPVAAFVPSMVHPNLLSVAAALMGVGAGLAAASQAYGLGLGLWMLSRIVDGLDGVVARRAGSQSDFGGYLDILLDYVAYIAVPVGLVYGQPTTANLWVGAALLFSYQINSVSWTVLSALLEKRHMASRDRPTSFEIPVGLIEGTETIAFYILFFLLPQYLTPLIGLMAGLVFLTAGQRVWWASRHLT